MKVRMWSFLTAAVVFLLSFSPAEACTCVAMHLQLDYCSSNIVVKGKFLSITSPEDQKSTPIPPENEWDTYYTYSVEILEVFQGPANLKHVTFKSHSMICPLYLPDSALNIEYLITGSLSSGEVLVGFCNYVVPWSQVSVHQIKGIKGAYSKGCACKITTPYTDWTQTNRCLHDEYGPLGTTQDKKQRCVPAKKGTCRWEDIPV